MRNFFNFFLCFFLPILLFSCHRVDKDLLIIDTDIGNSTDDLFALDMAYAYMDEGKADLKGVVVSREGDGFYALADIVNTHYRHPEVPVAVERNGIKNSTIHIDYRMLDDLNIFTRTDTDFSDNLDGYKFYRKVLSESPDKSVKIVAIGFISCLLDLLESSGDEYSPLSGIELVSKKVEGLYFMATKLGSNDDPGYNLRYDIPKGKKFFELWPKDIMIYLSPSPVGGSIEYKSSEILADSKNEKHPIYQTYKNKNCETGQKLWDALAVINAVEPERFTFSNKGFISFSDEGKIIFTENENGNVCYQLLPGQEWSGEILNLIKRAYLKN
ncbi:MAG: hypothetical protein K5873_12570 [Treponema sp.]|nr:hypothetical protein [Treponema sp.]